MNCDPKPQLSATTIKHNIEYYQSICEKYREAILLAEQDLAKWQQRLKELENDS